MNIPQKLLISTIPFLLFGQALAQDTPNLEFGGRLQGDMTNYDNDKFQYTDGSELRRARLFIRGDLAENWDYKLQFDFAPDNTELKDGYIRYSGIKNSRITFGNFKQFSSLEDLTSSNNITFTERALPISLVTSRRMGIGYQTWNDSFNFGISAFGNEANNKARGSGVATRFAYRPQLGDDIVLHLGINAAWEEPDGDSVRRRERPESHQDSHRIVDTGTISGVDSFNKIGLEGVYVNGRFSAQSEFVRQDIQRDIGSDVSLDSYYAYVSYFLTDDSRPYSSSNAGFGTLTPSSEKGAWEIAARVSNLDLTDGNIAGGEVDIITIGLNYYMNKNLRFTANYIMADSDKVAGNDDPNAIQLRIRYTF